MNTITNASLPVRLRTASTPLQRLWDWARSQWQGWQRARRLARDEAAFRALDPATLRDLGVSVSEAGSFWAEHAGLESATRQRVQRERSAGAAR